MTEFILDSVLVRLLGEGPRGGRPIDVDAYLMPVVTKLKRAYRTVGNPTLLYLAGYSFAGSLRMAQGTSASFQYSQLLAFLAEMLLAEGRDAQSLERGLGHLEEAKEVLMHVPTWSQEIMNAQISYALHEGVILKALGRFDEAILGMRGDTKRLRDRNGATSVDLVMLHRQEVIMQQDAGAFATLADNAAVYRRSHPAEYYGTVKRVFEFALNTDRIQAARILFPVFTRAFRAARHKLPQLSHVSFTKNAGQFLAVAQDERRGVRVLHSSLAAARRLNLRGQERQIAALVGEFGSQSRVSLQVFRV